MIKKQNSERPTPPQYQSFVKAARELGCDEDPAHFDEILRKVARHKPTPKVLSEPKKPKAKTVNRRPS